MAKRLVIANWKMNGSLALADEMVAGFAAQSNVDVIVVPPAVFVSRLIERAQGSFEVGLQDVSQFDNGAHTGDVSASMAADLGATAAIVGHSERRDEHGESDAVIAAKALKALAAGLMPVICVGESLAEEKATKRRRECGLRLRHKSIVLALSGDIAIAYEPLWAIGTGKSASAAEAVAMLKEIRKVLRKWQRTVRTRYESYMVAALTAKTSQDCSPAKRFRGF